MLRSTLPSIGFAIEDESIIAVIARDDLRAVAKYLAAQGWRLGTIVATERDGHFEVRYCLYATRHPGWVQLVISLDPVDRTVPSLTPVTIAADWFEREIEDLFSVRFAQHPRLGDFVLHDNKWAEDAGLMRPFVQTTRDLPEQQREWRPKRVLEEEGAFMMPVGPIFSGDAESALFLLETVGEDVVRAIPRLFYKYRAIEKIAEGRTAEDVLLLAERCAGTSAIGNGLAYCRAVERATGLDVPPRAQILRGFFAELERLRHHMTSIREICVSTSLTVAASQALWLEEQLLRISGEVSDHRYLFGLLAIAGLLHDVPDDSLRRCLASARTLWPKVDRLRAALENSSSFLDRIERVGIVDEKAVRTFELVGPFARAGGVAADMRTIQPYAPYSTVKFDVPTEVEGDGYARLRVLFAEMRESLRIMTSLCDDPPQGSVRAPLSLQAGRALGWSEAPRGASVQWVEVAADGTIARYRLTPPSFRNWHGFHIATEGFAFQDFPIVLATLDLSVAENDR
jgi:Ni,Fe-hydrogenase III large subunit/Ni,Fe-hydrogenase III component G